jgi:predicted GTPase
VGIDLHSCTSEIQLSKPFILDGRRVVLIDTPGFNDTTKGDFEILRIITAFLEKAYVQHPLLPVFSFLTNSRYKV